MRLWRTCQSVRKPGTELGTECEVTVPYFGLFATLKDNKTCGDHRQRKRRNRLFQTRIVSSRGYSTQMFHRTHLKKRKYTASTFPQSTMREPIAAMYEGILLNDENKIIFKLKKKIAVCAGILNRT